MKKALMVLILSMMLLPLVALNADADGNETYPDFIEVNDDVLFDTIYYNGTSSSEELIHDNEIVSYTGIVDDIYEDTSGSHNVMYVFLKDNSDCQPLALYNFTALSFNYGELYSSIWNEKIVTIYCLVDESDHHVPIVVHTHSPIQKDFLFNWCELIIGIIIGIIVALVLVWIYVSL